MNKEYYALPTPSAASRLAIQQQRAGDGVLNLTQPGIPAPAFD